MNPNKLIVKLDSQILNSMNLCAERYKLEMVDHWRPQKKTPAMEKGSIIHKMAAYYYQARKDGLCVPNMHHLVVEECNKIARVYGSTLSISVDEVNDLLIPTFQEYVLKWQYDGWEVLDVEQPFTKILHDSDDLQILWEGVIDLRVIDPKLGQIVVDTKSEARKSYPYILSNQFQGYEWAFGVPVVVNKIGFQTSLTPQERFRRLVHESGPEALEEWRLDVVDQVIEAIGWHDMMAQGLRLRKNRTSCDKYSGCIFQKVCKAPENVREFKLQAYFYKDKPWDPYTRDEDSFESDENDLVESDSAFASEV